MSPVEASSTQPLSPSRRWAWFSRSVWKRLDRRTLLRGSARSRGQVWPRRQLLGESGYGGASRLSLDAAMRTTIVVRSCRRIRRRWAAGDRPALGQGTDRAEPGLVTDEVADVGEDLVETAGVVGERRRSPWMDGSGGTRWDRSPCPCASSITPRNVPEPSWCGSRVGPVRIAW